MNEGEDGGPKPTVAVSSIVEQPERADRRFERRARGDIGNPALRERDPNIASKAMQEMRASARFAIAHTDAWHRIAVWLVG